jgi:hypothetical protein
MSLLTSDLRDCVSAMSQGLLHNHRAGGGPAAS